MRYFGEDNVRSLPLFEIGDFFDAIGIDLINGYGITECSPLVCANHDMYNDFKTVGIKLPCIEWRIDQPNDEGIGEICVKGDIVMIGYYKQPELTAEVLKDGWFYTGDYGYINEKDQLVISGRKKNIIVLNNGKNVCPEEIEGYIQDIDYINEVVVSGEKDKDGNMLSALPDRDNHSIDSLAYALDREIYRKRGQSA